MVFRLNEAIENGMLTARRRLLENLPMQDREQSERKLKEIMDIYGPVVECYPIWHPLVSKNDKNFPVQEPSKKCGYEGLDHLVFFRNAFISCTYDGQDEICDSVKKLRSYGSDNVSKICRIEAEVLNEKFYSKDTTAVLVKCEWNCESEDGFISKKYALPLMIETEMQLWTSSEIAHSWEKMRPYLLGIPCGKESSLFVNRSTGNAMKWMYNSLVASGMFGALEQ